MVNIQLHVVACPAYPDKFMRDMFSHHLYTTLGCNCHTAGSYTHTHYYVQTEVLRVVAWVLFLVFLPVEFETFDVAFVADACRHLLSKFLQKRLRFSVELCGRRRRRRPGFVWNNVEVHSRLRVRQVLRQSADRSHEAQARCVAGSRAAQNPALDFVFGHCEYRIVIPQR